MTWVEHWPATVVVAIVILLAGVALGGLLAAIGRRHEGRVLRHDLLRGCGGYRLAALILIERERVRQVVDERYTPEQDNACVNQELAQAAAYYAAPVGCAPKWPWVDMGHQPHNHRRLRELVIAGALILAEIERRVRTSDVYSLDFYQMLRGIKPAVPGPTAGKPEREAAVKERL